MLCCVCTICVHVSGQLCKGPASWGAQGAGEEQEPPGGGGARQAQRQLAEIVSGSPVATFVLDENCRATHWNRACETLTGVLAAEVISKDEVWRAFYPDESRRVVLAELIVRGVSIEQLKESYAERAHPSALVQGAFEARDFFPAFGESGKWLHFMAAPLHDIRGNVVGAIETLVDLSDRAPGK